VHRDARDPSYTVAYSVCMAARELELDAIVVPTLSGRSARLVSAHRPTVPIYALSPGRETIRRCGLMWGVRGEFLRKHSVTEELLLDACRRVVELGWCERGQRVAVTAGLPSAKARAQETARLLEWAFREFRPYRLFRAGETVAEADVWLGAEDTVPLTIERSATVVLSRAARRGMTATLVYDAPLEAPVAKGERVAKLVVRAPGAAAAEFPVLAGADVDELSGVPRALATAGEMLKDWTDDLFPMPRSAP
jgi:hypothetical protein